MPAVCSVCVHESRGLIDRLLAGGGTPLRNVAEQFGLSTTAVHRHKEHVVKQVQQAMERRKEAKEQQIASKWMERLEKSYDASARGIARCEDSNDSDVWPQSARYVVASLKAIELGLRADGVIEGAGKNATTTVNIEQVLVLPSRPAIEQEEIHKLPYGLVETYVEPEPES